MRHTGLKVYGQRERGGTRMSVLLTGGAGFIGSHTAVIIIRSKLLAVIFQIVHKKF